MNATITGIFTFNGKRLIRVQSSDSKIFLDDDFKKVDVKNENDLQTVMCMIAGKLQNPWLTFSH